MVAFDGRVHVFEDGLVHADPVVNEHLELGLADEVTLRAVLRRRCRR